MSDEDLDTIEARANAATNGPWRYNPGKQWFTDLDKLRASRAGVFQTGGEEFIGAGPTDATIGVAVTGLANHPQSMADAQFIAHARADVPALIAEVQRLREGRRP